MKQYRLCLIDAFTEKPFGGNPAGLCILDGEIPDWEMQAIAGEVNVSETAFIYAYETSRDSNTFGLRWFSPRMEMPLCGHATIGAARFLFEERCADSEEINFNTKSGTIIARRTPAGIALEFAQDERTDIDPPAGLIEAMGIKSFEGLFRGRITKKIVIRLKSAEDVLALQPDFTSMLKISDMNGVGVTCPGNEKYDFISRYFNPWAGVNEDPVTGSVHTLLAPYWGEILKKKEMLAFQASRRGGEISIRLEGNKKVVLCGKAVIVFKGEIYV